MYQVVFVCLGNICRSPLAAVTFQRISQSQASSTFQVISAGTYDGHVGQGADHRSRAVALQFGYSQIESHRAQLLSKKILSPSASRILLIAMDHSNLNDAREIISSAATQDSRISFHLFSDFGGDAGNTIPDPYYGNIKDFEAVLKQCERYSDELIKTLKAAV